MLNKLKLKNLRHLWQQLEKHFIFMIYLISNFTNKI